MATPEEKKLTPEQIENWRPVGKNPAGVSCERELVNPTEWRTESNGDTWFRDSDKIDGQWGLIIPTFDGCESYLCLPCGSEILVGILPTMKEARAAVDELIDKPFIL